MPRVVVVGGGVSGLAAAVSLVARGADVTVLEAGAQVGGNTQSLREDGFTVDAAANGWLDSEPAMDRLLNQIGAAASTVPASDKDKRRWIFADGQSHLLPGSPPAFLASPLLPWGAKLRLLMEIFVPRGGGEDETVAAFATRRIGRVALDRLVAPMVAGVYGGDPDRLSLAAAFPRMVALEREHRSLILAMIRLGRGGAPSGRLQTLEGGAGALPKALAAWLGDRVQTGVAVSGIARRENGWRVLASDGALDADAVVVACPAFTSAALVRTLAPEAAAALDGVPYAPIAVVAAGYPTEAWVYPPDGFGVLVARGERLGVLGALYSSCIYPRQAPQGQVLIRAMIGGGVEPTAAALDDAALRERMDYALERLLGKARAEPSHTWIFRHPRGIPQYAPGHLRRIAAVRAAETALPGLVFTGNYIDGIGVKDCARAGERVAERVVPA